MLSARIFTLGKPSDTRRMTGFGSDSCVIGFGKERLVRSASELMDDTLDEDLLFLPIATSSIAFLRGRARRGLLAGRQAFIRHEGEADGWISIPMTIACHDRLQASLSQRALITTC